MKRREFVALIGSTAATWPLAAQAQQSAMPLVGFLSGGSPVPSVSNVAAFRKGLSETGYAEGQNISIEYRWANGQFDRLPALATELVSRTVAVIAATGGTASVLAAKAATTTIPIIFSTGGDPVKLGIVASLNRPGGNVTGVSFLANTLGMKRMELLHTLIPKSALIGLLANPLNPNYASEISDMEAAARAFGQQVLVMKARNDDDLDGAFATFDQQRVSAISVVSDAFFNSRREALAAFEKRYSIPAIFSQRLFTVAGGLMSYGPSLTDAYQLVGNYTGQILKGKKPADLPVIQSVKFEFVLNLKTAETLGLGVPPSLLALADEVIE